MYGILLPYLFKSNVADMNVVRILDVVYQYAVTEATCCRTWMSDTNIYVLLQ